ncbi:hypothetical protein SK128_016120 [Halocaridina rubra]|uniref:Immunoglobulin I-set domain-containing protein n=1 Tax=Halocaridina rubra TaxID=373956 RepID=A0AAN8WHH4_HALRR
MKRLRRFLRGRNGGGSHLRSDYSRGNQINDETNDPSNSRESSNANRSASARNTSNRRQQSSDNKRNKSIVSSLSVRGVEEQDAGVYKCVAKSVAGEASSQARIRVVPRKFINLFTKSFHFRIFPLGSTVNTE